MESKFVIVCFLSDELTENIKCVPKHWIRGSVEETTNVLVAYTPKELDLDNIDQNYAYETYPYYRATILESVSTKEEAKEKLNQYRNRERRLEVPNAEFDLPSPSMPQQQTTTTITTVLKRTSTIEAAKIQTNVFSEDNLIKTKATKRKLEDQINDINTKVPKSTNQQQRNIPRESKRNAQTTSMQDQQTRANDHDDVAPEEISCVPSFDAFSGMEDYDLEKDNFEKDDFKKDDFGKIARKGIKNKDNLKHPEDGPGLVELRPNSGLFVNKKNLKTIENCTNDVKHLLMGLLLMTFTNIKIKCKDNNQEALDILYFYMYQKKNLSMEKTVNYASNKTDTK